MMAPLTELTFPNSKFVVDGEPTPKKKLLPHRRKTTSFHITFVEKSCINHNILIEQPRLYLKDTEWIEIVTKSWSFNLRNMLTTAKKQNFN